MLQMLTLARSIVAMLVSGAAAIRLSLQPSSSFNTSAFSKMRAYSWAERLPLRSTRRVGRISPRLTHHVLLDGNPFPDHESPPSPSCSDKDSQIAVIFNDGSDC
jgi:hypothetical protein